MSLFFYNLSSCIIISLLLHCGCQKTPQTSSSIALECKSNPISFLNETTNPSYYHFNSEKKIDAIDLSCHFQLEKQGSYWVPVFAKWNRALPSQFEIVNHVNNHKYMVSVTERSCSIVLNSGRKIKKVSAGEEIILPYSVSISYNLNIPGLFSTTNTEFYDLVLCYPKTSDGERNIRWTITRDEQTSSEARKTLIKNSK